MTVSQAACGAMRPHGSTGATGNRVHDERQDREQNGGAQLRFAQSQAEPSQTLLPGEQRRGRDSNAYGRKGVPLAGQHADKACDQQSGRGSQLQPLSLPERLPVHEGDQDAEQTEAEQRVRFAEQATESTE